MFFLMEAFYKRCHWPRLLETNTRGVASGQQPKMSIPGGGGGGGWGRQPVAAVRCQIITRLLAIPVINGHCSEMDWNKIDRQINISYLCGDPIWARQSAIDNRKPCIDLNLLVAHKKFCFCKNDTFPITLAIKLRQVCIW